MAVLDIRGTHGSGKSWVVHQLLGGKKEDLYEDGVFLGYYLPELDCAVVGKYTTTCGGCDGIKKPDEVGYRVKLFAQRYRHVVLEGILVAHTFQRYSDLARFVGNYHFCFLNTPLAVCINRVKARRLAAGNTKEFNPIHVIRDWHCIWEKVQEKCRRAGHNVCILPYREPLPPLLALLQS